MGGSHRQHFIGRWEHHYAAVRRLLSSLTVRRFTTLIAYADVLNLWSYPSLRQDDVAVVLLVLAGFMRLPDVAEAADGARWARFWFDASVYDVDDLWKLRPAPPKLFRVEYREPDVTPFPTGEQVLRWTAAELELVDQTIGVSLGADGQDTSASGLRREDVLEFERFAARDRGAWVP